MFEVLNQPGARVAASASVGGAAAHPFMRWRAEYADVHLLLQLIQGVAHLALGYGLVRRHAWGLRLGAIVLGVGVGQLLLSVVLLLAWGPPTLPSIPRSVQATMPSQLATSILLGTAFYGFVFWKFTQLSVQEEFVEGPGRRTMK
jgi:hypothetical protein